MNLSKLSSLVAPKSQEAFRNYCLKPFGIEVTIYIIYRYNSHK